MLLQLLKKNKYAKALVHEVGKHRARVMVKRILPFLNKNKAILDLGCGRGIISETLLKEGLKVTPLDVQDLSFVERVRPVIYDGEKIPFDADAFDVSLLITVLHHTPEPEKIIIEAQRVSKRMVIIEDVYVNWIHRQITYFVDGLLNLQFKGQPHSNKSDEQWKETFKELGLQLKHSQTYFSGVIQHALYLVESADSTKKSKTREVKTPITTL